MCFGRCVGDSFSRGSYSIKITVEFKRDRQAAAHDIHRPPVLEYSDPYPRYITKRITYAPTVSTRELCKGL